MFLDKIYPNWKNSIISSEFEFTVNKLKGIEGFPAEARKMNKEREEKRDFNDDTNLEEDWLVFKDFFESFNIRQG